MKVPLFLRSLFYTLLCPGTVAGLVPLWLIEGKWNEIMLSAQWYQWLGLFLLILGAAVLVRCIVEFATRGKGTLSPTDPTKKLVISGLYKRSRNPMYLGVVTMLLGWALATMQSQLWWYALAVFIGFNFFIHFVEEPRLRKDFGDEYTEYCKKVRRWI